MDLKVQLYFLIQCLENRINKNTSMSSIRKFTSYIFLLIIISCGKTKTEMNDIEIIFDNELMIFKKNSKPYTGSIVEYHNNNRVKIEIKVLNGLKNGNIKQFYASGKKQTNSNFKNGKLFGKFTSFYENGNNQIITFYNNDLRMGSFEEFYENGRLKMCGNYSNGLKIGEFKEFFKSGGTATYNY